MTTFPTKIPVSKIISGKTDDSIRKEFDKLEDKARLRPQPPTLKATLLKNKPFNADPNVIPYDFSRVEISHVLNEGDYVNASWINRLKEEKDYDSLIFNQYLPQSLIGLIVCQAPTDATIGQQLRMIYENDIEMVIQISGKNAKSAYEKDCSGSHVTKTVIEVEKLEKFLTKEVWDLTTERGKTSRLVHLCLETLHDDGKLTLDDLDNILKTISFVRREIGIKRDSINIVAHDDQGGVSGAAVFVALLHALEDMDDKSVQSESGTEGPLKASKETNTLDVFSIVDELRKKRMKMVCNQEDYVLIFKAMQRYAQNWRVFQSILEMKNDPKVNAKKKDPYLPMAPLEVEYVLADGSDEVESSDENILGASYESMELEPFDASKLGPPTTTDPSYLTL